MEYSEKFDVVKRYYDLQVWDKVRVKHAVEKHWITEEEFEKITGVKYE